MAFRFGDPGGAIYQTAGASGANILAHWTTATNVGTWSVSAGTGRISGTPSLRLANLNSPALLIKTLNSSVQTLGVALAIRYNGALPSNIVPFLTFTDGGTNQVDVRIKTDGTLQVTRNATVLGTSTAMISTGAYYHIEFKVKIDPTVGTVEVRLNGVTVIGPLTAQNTRNTTNSTVNGVTVGNNISSGGGGTVDFCDIIVWDTVATDANGFTDISDFIGDCGLSWLLPTGAGTTTQFTPGAGSNFAQVNEATPDGDTTYVEDATIGHIDTYACADLPASVTTVKSVAQIHYARKTDVGSRGMKAELRSASANTAHATEQALGNSYLYYFSGWGSNPNNGSPIAWTPITVNALEAGQTVSS